MTQQYPAGLPSPLVQDYRVEVSYGVSAVAFERGNTRQRRGVAKERHVFGLSLVLSISELWQWQSWANQYGYEWHFMDLTTSYSGAAGSTLIPHYIRYISDISIQSIDFQHVRVSVQAEMDINTLPLGAIVPSGDWIIAGTPDDPSADYILAGTPGSPSTDFIIAGSPSIPAA